MDFGVMNKLSDHDKENPFNTETGQQVVSVIESFEARNVRTGKTKSWTFRNFALTNGTAVQKKMYQNDYHHIFFPTNITVSCTVRAQVEIAFNPLYPDYLPNYGGDFLSDYETISLVRLEPFVPYHLPLKGQVQLYNNGILNISVTAYQDGGFCDANIFGTEVTYRV